MNVQHYNPLVDAQVAEKYGIPANWKLRAQAPFGSIAAPAADKDYMADGDRVKVLVTNTLRKLKSDVVDLM